MSDQLFRKLFDGVGDFSSPAKQWRFSEDDCDSPMMEYICARNSKQQRKDRRSPLSKIINVDLKPQRNTNCTKECDKSIKRVLIPIEEESDSLAECEELSQTLLSVKGLESITEEEDQIEEISQPVTVTLPSIESITLESLGSHKSVTFAQEPVECPITKDENLFKIVGPSSKHLSLKLRGLQIREGSPTSTNGNGAISGRRKRSSCLSLRPGQSDASPITKWPLKCNDGLSKIKIALDKVSDNPNLLSDGIRSYCLPTIPGKHQDLKSITADTLSKVINHQYDHIVEKYMIIDCRYPYEFDGGHMQEAKNLYSKESIMQQFLNPPIPKNGRNNLMLVFHCEFSSERAPKLRSPLSKIINVDLKPQRNTNCTKECDKSIKRVLIPIEEESDSLAECEELSQTLLSVKGLESITEEEDQIEEISQPVTVTLPSIESITLESLGSHKSVTFAQEPVECPITKDENLFKIVGPSSKHLSLKLRGLQIREGSPTSTNGNGAISGRRKRSSCLSLRPGQSDASPITKWPLKCNDGLSKIKIALDKVSDNPNLLSDGIRSYCLPTIPGKHQDLKSITADTLSKVINHQYDHIVEKYMIIDCRYPYEFDGGHMQEAKNLYSKESIMQQFLNPPIPKNGRNNLMLVFHCEFSSERAPKLCRFLRTLDRDFNRDNYPDLCYPEMYILHGGYKQFFSTYKEYCSPQSYVPMNHGDYREDLKKFRAKSKYFSGDSTRRGRAPNTRLML